MSIAFLLAVIILIIVLSFFGQILRKAGFNPWLALLGAIPLVNIIALWVFAFANWPAVPRR